MSAIQLGRLLIVDDEVAVKNVLCETLAERGYQTTGVTSGSEALAALREQQYDLLLTDLMMPNVDGIQVLRSALELDPHIVGIIMTGQGTIQTVVEAMKIGAFDYVLKPFELEPIVAVVERALYVRRLRVENVQLRETVASYELATTISYTLDANALLSKTVDAALQQVDADEASIMLPTDDGKELYVAVTRGDRHEHALGQRLPIEQGIAGWVARHREPLSLTGVVDDPRFQPQVPRPDIQASLTVPMLVGGKLVGVLSVASTRRRTPFTLGQSKALTILASTAGAALETAALFNRVREAEEKYRSIFERATEGIFQLSADGRLATANPTFARIFGYESPAEAVDAIDDAFGQLHADPDRGAELSRLLAQGEPLWGSNVQPGARVARSSG